MNPDQYCQDKVAVSGSSLYYSFLFLPAEKRKAMLAVHAFCREVNDVVVDCGDAHVARTTLAWWRAQVTEIYAGTPQHPVAQALVPVVRQYNLPQEQFLEIIDGVDMNLQQPRYPDFKSLQLYCYRVASVVWLLAAEILGYADRNTLKHAHDLGIALQLTNLIRDVGDDARRNRIYLPMDELERFGVPAADILQARETENFQKLMAFQVERARQYYQQALSHLPTVDRKSQHSGLIMASLCQATLDEVVGSGCHVLKERVSLTPLRKLWLAWKVWARN